jgi:4-amino-4-deoxy-L-arabinose transferase-like glycosyltransferase
VILAFNPSFREAADRVLADFPFLLLSLLTFTVLTKWYGPGPLQDGRRVRYGINSALLTGFLLYLCYATREIGIILVLAVLAVLAYDLLRFRKVRWMTGLAILVFLALSTIQHVFLNDTAMDEGMQQRIIAFSQSHGVTNVPLSHFESFGENLSPDKILRQARWYVGDTLALWPGSESVWIKRGVTRLPRQVKLSESLHKPRHLPHILGKVARFLV